MNNNKTYLKHTWADPKLVAKKSKIDGMGVFTEGDIKAGETLFIWGGEKVSMKDLDDSRYHILTLVPIDNETYLGLPIEDDYKCVEELMNHSCDANTWLNDEVTVVARRDIKKGEEVTLDHATWDNDEEWDYTENDECTCGSSDCRKNLTSKDWMIPSVQQKYAGHFSPYIAELISKL